MIVLIGFLVGIGAMVAPSIRRQTSDLAKELPKVIDQIEQKVGSSGASKALGLQAPQQQKQGAKPQTRQQQQQQQQQPQQQEQPQQQQQQQKQGGLSAQL